MPVGRHRELENCELENCELENGGFIALPIGESDKCQGGRAACPLLPSFNYSKLLDESPRITTKRGVEWRSCELTKPLGGRKFFTL